MNTLRPSLARQARSTRLVSLRRNYASATPEKSNALTYLLGGTILAVGGYGGYSYYQVSNGKDPLPFTGILASTSSSQTGWNFGKITKDIPGDYKEIYREIAEALEKDAEGYDDGSYGPVLVRLAWHASGTFDVKTGTGGSNGATMRFAPEADHGANAGLHIARNVLEPIKKKFPWISYGDLWTLAGVCAIQQMGGPVIPWRPGREDRDESFVTPDGRLPDASLDSSHLRNIFYRMGFNDQEIVALSGAHSLGRCHTDRSGFSGPWQFAPTSFNNEYFRLLFEEKWQWKKWNGPKQYEDKTTKGLMMLPTDLELVKDKEFRKTAQLYAKDQDKFFEDFAKVFNKLIELGVPFKEGAPHLKFDVISE